MKTASVAISKKYQIAFPPALRKELKIRPGQKFRVIRYQNRIELLPVKSVEKARGFLKGIDSTVEREKDRI